MAEAESNGNGNGNKLNIGPLMAVLTVLITMFTLGAGAHFAFIRPLEREIDHLRDNSAQNTQRIDRLIESEQQRNNSVEQRIARVEAFAEFSKGAK